MSVRAPVGDVNIADKEYCIGRGLAGISAEKCDAKFLYYYLRTIKPQIESVGTGSTFKAISKSIIESIAVPVPPLDSQRKIVAILDKAEETKRLRVQVNELTQNLLQSVFLEIFGDPGTNKKGWDVKPLQQVAQTDRSIQSGPFGSMLKVGEYVSEGVPVLGIEHVGSNRFLWEEPKFITSEKAKELGAFRVKHGDLIISRAGTVGRVCIVPTEYDGAIFGSNLLRVRLDRKKMLPIFFSVILNFMPSMIEQINNMSPGGAYAFLNSKNLKSLKIIAPPISTQCKFSELMDAIEKKRFFDQMSIEAASQLSRSLFSKAFTGELVA